MRTIIALMEKPKQGKTTTLGMLYQTMKEQGFDILKDKKKSDSKDFFVIFEKNGKKIGLTSYGDSVELLKSRFAVFDANHCEIIICACRKSGPIYDFVDNYIGFSVKNFILKFTPTNLPQEIVVDKEDFERLNKEDVKRLLALINDKLN